MPIPGPGESVTGAAEYVDGAESFTVTVNTSGEISYPEATTAASGSTGGPAGCDDWSQSNADREQAGTYHWSLGDGVRPAGLSTSETADMLKQSVGWLTGTHNDCGLAERSNATASYDGLSSLESDITVTDGGYECTDGSLDDHDGESVVDFGNIDDHGDPPLALTCTWATWNPGDEDNITQADIRFDTTDYDWFQTRPKGCVNKWDLRSVAVHEFGHAFGLIDLDPRTSGFLTMSGVTEDCAIGHRTLGRGDIYSMWTVY